MAHSSQHRNSEQSASQTFPPLSNLPPLANQPDFSSQLQVQKLCQDLAHAQKQIQEYQHLIASLYTSLHNIESKICVNCRTHLETYDPGLGTSSAVIVSPSSKLKFSLPRPSTPARSSESALSNRVPFWHRVLKTHSRPSDSASSDIPGGSGLSQLSNAKVSDFQPNRSVSVSSESIQPSSLSVAQQPISLPETSTCPKYVPNQLDWSVDFDGDVKPALKVKLEHVLTPGAVVGRVRFSPDGKYLAVGVNDGRTYIYDVKTWAKTCFLADNSETSERAIWSLCFSPDGRYLAVGAAGGQLKIWEIAKRRIRNTFRGHTNTITDLDFSPDGRFLVSCSYDRTVHIWGMRDGFSKVFKDKIASVFDGVKFNLDGRYIAAGDGDGMLRMWNVRTSQLVEKWKAHGKVVWSVAFTLDGKGLVSSSGDGTWKYWDITSLELSVPGYGMTKSTMAGQKSKVTADTYDISSLVVSLNSQWLVSGSGDNDVSIWDLHNADLQCTLKGHKSRVWSVDFCPTGNYLASGSADGRVALWRYEAA